MPLGACEVGRSGKLVPGQFSGHTTLDRDLECEAWFLYIQNLHLEFTLGNLVQCQFSADTTTGGLGSTYILNGNTSSVDLRSRCWMKKLFRFIYF